MPQLANYSSKSEQRLDDSLADLPSLSDREQVIHNYMHRAKEMATALGLPEYSTNLQDVALDMLLLHNYDVDKAMNALSTVDKKAFKEPELSSAELKKFEDVGNKVWL